MHTPPIKASKRKATIPYGQRRGRVDHAFPAPCVSVWLQPCTSHLTSLSKAHAGGEGGCPTEQASGYPTEQPLPGWPEPVPQRQLTARSTAQPLGAPAFGCNTFASKKGEQQNRTHRPGDMGLGRQLQLCKANRAVSSGRGGEGAERVIGGPAVRVLLPTRRHDAWLWLDGHSPHVHTCTCTCRTTARMR